MLLTQKPAIPEAIAEAARFLLVGGLVAYPTETFYGLACDPRRIDAVMRLFGLKGRDPGRALPLVAGSRDQVGLACPDWEKNLLAVRLAEAFWPGPLSLILPGSGGLADFVRAPDGSTAIRWSSHPVASFLALKTGFPIVSTSANLSGTRPCRYANEVIHSLGRAGELWLLDGGGTTGGLPSTLVDVRGGRPVIVRTGAVDETEIRSAAFGSTAQG